jgi:hypothetical protein
MSNPMNPNWHWQPPRANGAANAQAERLLRGHKPPPAKEAKVRNLAKKLGVKLPVDLGLLFK